MTGECSFDGDFRCFEVADFADEDDVGILAQEGPEGGRKVQSNLLLHLYLVDAKQVEFDRIFGGHDVRVDRIQRL